MVNAALAGQDLVNQLVWLVDPVNNWVLDQFLAVKAGHLDLLVGSDDNTLSPLDFVSSQFVLNAF